MNRKIKLVLGAKCLILGFVTYKVVKKRKAKKEAKKLVKSR